MLKPLLSVVPELWPKVLTLQWPHPHQVHYSR